MLRKFLPFLLLFLVSGFINLKFSNIDFEVYRSYISSVVEDGDLNIANQKAIYYAQTNQKVILTPTGYDSDYHPHGLVIFYLPFYLLAKIFPKEWELINPFLSFGTVFYLIMGLKILYGFFLKKASSRTSINSLLLILIGTPLLFYSIFLPGNANIISFFLSAALLVFYFTTSSWTPSRIFLFSALISLLIIVKQDAVFYLILLIPPLLSSFSLKKILLVMFGLLSFIVPFLFNNYRQFGKIFLSQGGVDFDTYLLIELLFNSSHGYLFISPLIALILFLLPTVKEVFTDKKLFLFLLPPFIKLIAESFASSSSTDFGARNYIIDLPIFSYLILILLQQKNLIFKTSSFFLSAWTLFNLISYLERPFNMPIQLLAESYWFSSATYTNLLTRFNPTIAIIFSPILYIIMRTPFNLINVNKVLISSWAIYITISSFNYFSTSKIPSPLPNNYLIGDGAKIWHYYENMSGLLERRDYFLLRNELEKAQEEEAKMAKYREEARTQIIKGELEE